MDPLSGLAVACAVVQFVDFGAKVLSKGRKLYQSHSGAIAKHDELDQDAHRLRVLVSEYNNQTTTLPASVAAGMNDILNECNVTATLLVSLLEDLKVRDTASMGGRIARIFRSAQQAVRTAVKQSQIDDLNEMMKRLRDDIQGYILTMLQ
jgi:hypothetical protein